MRILIVSSEVAPFAKTGGLADVAGALPRYLAEAGHDVRIMMPLYGAVDRERWHLIPLLPEIAVEFGGRWILGNVARCSYPCGIEVPVYFIAQDDLFRRKGLYGENGSDYPDNDLRFAFFSFAALWTCKALDWAPDIIHLNDWQAGLIAPLLRHHPIVSKQEFFRPCRTVFTIHNLAYQGLFHPMLNQYLNLPPEVYVNGGEFYGKFSTLKAGIVFSDVVTTVSPTYAKEIQTQEFGAGMDGVLRSRAAFLHGILNGIDADVWNPERDPLIPSHYSADSLSGKDDCKQALRMRFGLNDGEAPIMGMVSRMVAQKGFDLLQEALPGLLRMGWQFVLVGTGQTEFEQFFRDAAQRHPGQVGVELTYDEGLSHLVQAGSDVFAVPSRFEPSGLTQLYAMRYGTVPLVRKTGGLADSVKDATTPDKAQRGEGTGFVFETYETEGLLDAARRAREAYNDRSLWRQIQRNGMTRDWSWAGVVPKYERVYNLTRPRMASHPAP